MRSIAMVVVQNLAPRQVVPQFEIEERYLTAILSLKVIC